MVEVVPKMIPTTIVKFLAYFFQMDNVDEDKSGGICKHWRILLASSILKIFEVIQRVH